MINVHILDGVALTKFIYWIKNINKKKINEVQAQNKLESFRKLNKDYLYPSFDTIAGSGKNGAIVHYRAKKEDCKSIEKKDIFLCDSGGQYKYGTTDVTRTICFSKPKPRIRDIFTMVLKGHIAVANTNLEKDNIGKKIDIRARKFLKKSNLDYSHGTGHGVGFFLNVHEGPQSISKFNKVKIKEGMILSNEPGYYEKNNFGIRIENLLFVKKINKRIFFENLTLVPIEKELINYKLLTFLEKDYLFKYNINIYSKISKYLNLKERKWLASFI
jgi:Xaa-Pro aminopeptidase